MAMDCKDLTICDYVKHDGIIKIVDAVYLYSVSVHDPSEPWGVAKSELVSVDDIEPIKLTEEILVKNGFDFTKRNYGVVCKEDKHGDVELSKDENGFYWSINTDEYEISRIDYVHTLQHLLHLFGIEKELTI